MKFKPNEHQKLRLPSKANKRELTHAEVEAAIEAYQRKGGTITTLKPMESRSREYVSIHEGHGYALPGSQWDLYAIPELGANHGSGPGSMSSKRSMARLA